MRTSNNLVFNSINELIEELDNSIEVGNRRTASDKHEEDWCDTDSYDEARAHMLAGKLYDDLKGDVDKYRTKGTATKRTNQLGVVGHTVVC